MDRASPSDNLSCQWVGFIGICSTQDKVLLNCWLCTGDCVSTFSFRCKLKETLRIFCRRASKTILLQAWVSLCCELKNLLKENSLWLAPICWASSIIIRSAFSTCSSFSRYRWKRSPRFRQRILARQHDRPHRGRERDGRLSRRRHEGGGVKKKRWASVTQR